MNETALHMTRALLGRITHHFREEEHRDSFAEFFTVCQAGLEAYRLQDARRQHNLRPMGGTDVSAAAE